ncbi:MAG: hypothetical protein KF712_03205 [Akkermansiaceae bacterium]|nr:hypothetical protein [Akkermansiaceae bacterium]
MKISVRRKITETCTGICDSFAERTGICVLRDRLGHPISDDVVTLDITGYRQIESYTCGFVAGLMVLHTFRPEANIDRFFKAVRPTQKYGASARKVVNALRNFRIGVSIREDLDFSGIRKQIDNGFPIITCVHTDDPHIDHWVVIYGYGTKPNRVFIAANGLPYLARREYSFAEYSKLASPRRFGLVCWGKT